MLSALNARELATEARKIINNPEKAQNELVHNAIRSAAERGKFEMVFDFKIFPAIVRELKLLGYKVVEHQNDFHPNYCEVTW